MPLLYERQENLPLPSQIAASGVSDVGNGAPLSTASAPLATSSTSNPTITSPTSSSQTAVSSETTSPSSNGMSPGIIAAIVVPIVVVALVAPVVLYFCLTRHDRQQGKSRSSGSRISSRAYPDLGRLSGSQAEARSPTFRERSSDTQRLKASEIMNFDLGPTIEKPLPMVNITGTPDDDRHPPMRPERRDAPQLSEKEQGSEPPIGLALSHYPGTHDSLTIPVHLLHNRTSMQELSDENVRIARLATDSRTTLRGRDLDRVSDISAPEERTSRHVGGRELDEISDVSSLRDDDSDTLAITDHGGNILRQPSVRSSGQLR